MFGQADVFADGECAAHDVDRVHIEFAGDARGGFVFGVGEHADAGDQHDDGVGVANAGAVGVFAAFVVGRVIDRILLEEGIDFFLEGCVVDFRGVDIKYERTDFRAQEVIRAGSPHRGEFPALFRTDELHDDVRVVRSSPDPD